MQKKKICKRLLAASLALLLVVGGIGAYFTGTDTKSDAYTIGQIEVEVVGDNDLYKAENLTPNYEWSFTRSVKNVGINDAYVFMAVTLPSEEIFTHDLDGVHTDNTAALTQLFTYGTDNVAGVSSEWAPVTAGKFGDYDIAAIGDVMQNKSGDYAAIRNNNTITYVYAYVGDGATLARLSADAETDSIFDIMKFVNASDTVAQYNVEATVGKVQTQVFAIQADNVLETTYMEGRNDDGSEAINAVWTVLNNAANDKHLSETDAGEGKVLIPVTSKDEDGNDLRATSTLIEGEEREELLYSLEQAGLANADDVDVLIDVKADNFDGMADTTFDMSKVANEGDQVVILHYDETKGEWEYIGTETVVDGKVSGDFTSYSPVAFVIVQPAAKEKVTGALMGVGVYRDIYSESESVIASSAILNQLLAEEPGIYTQLASDYDMNGPYSHGFIGHDGFSPGIIRYGNIVVYGNDASGCVDYAGQKQYNWTSYEILSKTADEITVKFICDAADFSDLQLTWACGHGFDMTNYGVAVENGKLTWTTSFGTQAKTVTFKTVDANGNPVANVYVYADNDDLGRPNSTSVMFTTDENGVATLSIDKNAMPDGTYTLHQLNVDGTSLMPAEGLTLTISGTNDVVITITAEIPKAQVNINGYLIKRNGETEQPLSTNITIYKAEGFDAETGTGTVVATGTPDPTGAFSNFYKEVEGLGSVLTTFDANTEYVIYVNDGISVVGSATFTTGSSATQLFVYWNVDSGTLTVE